MARPASISTSGVDGGQNWSSGTYAYDGAGNVEAIGNDRFRYDKVSRLRESRMRLVPGLAGTEHTQTFSFDGFGNLLSITGTGGTSLPTSASTNRLTAGGAVFDDAGNLTSWSSNSYTFDRLNRMTERVTAGANQRLWKFLYTADDERLWSADTSAFGEQRVMVRDLDGKPLREYAYEPPAVQGSLTEGGARVSSFVGVCPASPPDDIFCDGFESGGTSAWLPPTDDRYRDWIHRGSQLLAADDSEDGRSHFHLDHLGTPRQITGVIPGGALVAQHAYLPYGAELPGSTQNHERLRFTGHERDLSNFSNPADDLDYMHARYSSPITGRFLSVDPLAASAAPGAPQTWNRYAYTAGNPLKYKDPDGQILETAFDVVMAGISIKQAISNPSFGNIAGAVLDVGAVLVPVVPAAGGRIIDAIQAGGNAIDAAGTANKVDNAADGARSVEGIYVVQGKTGTYVGQSGNTPARLQQHVDTGKVSPEAAASAETIPVAGGKTAREVAEQKQINALGGIENLENKRNPIGPKRQHLLEEEPK